MGQVAMITDHGGRRAMWIGGVGCPIGDRPSGQPREDAKGAWKGCPLPKTPQVVGQTKDGGVNGAELHCQAAAQSSTSCSTI